MLGKVLCWLGLHQMQLEHTPRVVRDACQRPDCSFEAWAAATDQSWIWRRT